MGTKSTGKKELSQFKNGDPVWIHAFGEYREACVVDAYEDVLFFRIGYEDAVYSSRETDYYPRSVPKKRKDKVNKGNKWYQFWK